MVGKIRKRKNPSPGERTIMIRKIFLPAMKRTGRVEMPVPKKSANRDRFGPPYVRRKAVMLRSPHG
ncbi:MAG: hypothetical protein JWL81_3502 [Verrucomicrobiales bacterium]|nr:hypothetical protein [Verrucomicrobiales bacterium]